MTAAYQPSTTILKKYAKVLVNFALGSKEGIAKNEVVECIVPDVAKPLALALQNEVLRAGGHVLMRIVPTGFEKDFFSLASKEQLTFFPAKYLKAKSDVIDHTIAIIADVDPFELESTPPEKLLLARDSRKKYREWLFEKEYKGKHTWTVGLWGVQAKADIVGLSLKKYWEQIIHACFLDSDDPIAEWRKVKTLQEQTRNALNKLSIESLHITGNDINLQLKLGPDRIWKGGVDRNIPSFELFTSPDWRGSRGWVKFNQPVYRYGNKIDGIELEFKNGLVAKARARVGQKILNEMLKSKNANKIGEFSLTDKRLSRITHPMAETLYDENMGGPFGNMHIAIGMAYKDCFRGKPSELTKNDWLERGFNDSAEHTDIVSTSDRTVIATLTSGEQIPLYQNGMYSM
ncbi:MAG: aminopeptidase [Candidatus Pacebacteria bacterium]|nr:aminopeptidase [Candidatus Paceibacterota bacterium]PIR60789.1 MAG: aminopeptidase [Candidatus Pacebacteria bacterium CG10_big_fil_rev_8_21_14_0_10_44_54]